MHPKREGERGVELAFFHGCPHAAQARENVRAALRTVGVEGGWIEWDLADDATPTRVRRFGSPTVLVAGHDVMGHEPAESSGLSCRAGGAPSSERIVAALRVAALVIRDAADRD